MIHFFAVWGAMNALVVVLAVVMVAVRAWDDRREAVRHDDYTETMLGLYLADRELHAAAERMDARWLEEA